MGVRPLIDEKLDDPLPEKGRVGVCHVEANHLDLAGKARVLHRLGGTPDHFQRRIIAAKGINDHFHSFSSFPIW